MGSCTITMAFNPWPFHFGGTVPSSHPVADHWTDERMRCHADEQRRQRPGACGLAEIAEQTVQRDGTGGSPVAAGPPEPQLLADFLNTHPNAVRFNTWKCGSCKGSRDMPSFEEADEYVICKTFRFDGAENFESKQRRLNWIESKVARTTEKQFTAGAPFGVISPMIKAKNIFSLILLSPDWRKLAEYLGRMPLVRIVFTFMFFSVTIRPWHQRKSSSGSGSPASPSVRQSRAGGFPSIGGFHAQRVYIDQVAPLCWPPNLGWRSHFAIFGLLGAVQPWKETHCPGTSS